jgi:RNA polymerase sigma factor (sigma-70 family)
LLSGNRMKPEKNLSDEELVKLFIETQNNRYFEVIYDRFADKIYRKCYSFVRDSAKAEDFMHDIFLKLILNLSNYKSDAKFSTYIFSITYNYCIDHIRQSKKLQEVELEGDFEEDDSSAWSEAREMDAQRLNKTLDSITTEEKSLILMKYQDDLSIKEIGDVLKLSESAVKMRLKRTKEKVKSIYLSNILFWGILISKLVLLLKDK